MRQRTFEEIKEKPLIYLTVEEFLNLQETLGKKSDTSTQFPEIMSIDIASRFTGYKKSTLYRKTCTNAIPFYRQGSRVLFKKMELEKWLLSNKQETVKEHIERLESELNNRTKRKINGK
ncbi:helix-turn-helix domain-containing protein [Parabacteroides sp. PF5-9]|uniref:helix-turn-helix domain-containing protein n=1 Tax=Parabacteroides sp. PF5-9 TaxID=1742404 RepID=UPI0024732B83|nr:helix-turn-helix domain-containing protein [Parabacteroides sp. PF5-9]MDH6357132.1 excisionase family DNA binding protein [Parabacteroides sp. PF5-9]